MWTFGEWFLHKGWVCLEALVSASLSNNDAIRLLGEALFGLQNVGMEGHQNQHPYEEQLHQLQQSAWHLSMMALIIPALLDNCTFGELLKVRITACNMTCLFTIQTQTADSIYLLHPCNLARCSNMYQTFYHLPTLTFPQLTDTVDIHYHFQYLELSLFVHKRLLLTPLSNGSSNI